MASKMEYPSQQKVLMRRVSGDLEPSSVEFHNDEEERKVFIDSSDAVYVGLKLETLSKRRSRPYKKPLSALFACFASMTVAIFLIHLCGAVLEGRRRQLGVHGRTLAGDETSSGSHAIPCETGDESSPLASGGASPTAPQSPVSQPRPQKRRREAVPAEVSSGTGATKDSSAHKRHAPGRSPQSARFGQEREASPGVTASEEFLAAEALLMLKYPTAKPEPQRLTETSSPVQIGFISTAGLPSASANEGSSPMPPASQPALQPPHRPLQMRERSEESSSAHTSEPGTITTSQDVSHTDSASSIFHKKSRQASEPAGYLLAWVFVWLCNVFGVSSGVEGTSAGVAPVDPADVPSPGNVVDIVSSEQETHVSGSPVTLLLPATQFDRYSTSGDDEPRSFSGSPAPTAGASELPELPRVVPGCSSVASTSSAIQGPGSPSGAVRKSGVPFLPSAGPTSSVLPLVPSVGSLARQHPYYRLPRVDPSHQSTRRFNPILATSRSLAHRSPTFSLQMMRELLLRESLTPEDLDVVCKLTHQLAAHANYFESQSTKRKPRYAALPILGRRFLVLEYLLCGLQLLGEPAQGAWWASVSNAVNSEDSPPTESSVYTAQAVFNRQLSRQLCAALNTLKTGRRLTEGIGETHADCRLQGRACRSNNSSTKKTASSNSSQQQRAPKQPRPLSTSETTKHLTVRLTIKKWHLRTEELRRRAGQCQLADMLFMCANLHLLQPLLPRKQNASFWRSTANEQSHSPQ
ncbi:hypothetical protein ACSSS7_001579 [Eimeria intestinalis]